MAMDSSSAQPQHQEMSSQTLESCTKSQPQEKKPKPADMQATKCPRCDSSNTKFCYYNNYSLSQPRYFCKSCRRYWTKGGTLRNVPVGGGCRRNKRSSSSSKISQDNPIPTPIPALVDPLSHDHSKELSLAIARLQKQSTMGLDDYQDDLSIWGNPNMAHHQQHYLGFIENPTCLYYGMGMSGTTQEMGIPFEDFSGSDGGGRVLWQDMSTNGADLDFSRSVNWNGIGSSNWNGLLNSPLM